MWPSVAGVAAAAAATPRSVSEVPRERARSPARASPSPAIAHGLSPEEAATTQPSLRPLARAAKGETVPTIEWLGTGGPPRRCSSSGGITPHVSILGAHVRVRISISSVPEASDMSTG